MALKPPPAPRQARAATVRNAVNPGCAWLRGRGSVTSISAAIRPSASTSTRSASKTASSTSCVTSSVVGRCARHRSVTSPCMRIRVSASRAANGSSSSSRRGSRTKARARATRCASPPDNVAGHASRWRCNPTSRSAASARPRASRPLRPSVTLRHTCFHGSRRGSWNATATGLGSVIRASAGAGSRPASVRSSVVLPDPLRPSRAVNDPAARSRSSASSTVFAPKRRVRRRIETPPVLGWGADWRVAGRKSGSVMAFIMFSSAAARGARQGRGVPGRAPARPPAGRAGRRPAARPR